MFIIALNYLIAVYSCLFFFLNKASTKVYILIRPKLASFYKVIFLIFIFYFFYN